MAYTKEILKTHVQSCNNEVLHKFAETLVHYISSNAVEYYQWRIERNREKEQEPIYTSFWGELQYELLPYLPLEKLGKEYGELFAVLERRFEGIESHYRNGKTECRTVTSPVSGKRIGIRQWKQIITNTKLVGKKRTPWIETKTGYIESSIETFSESFASVVREDPQKMMKMVLNNSGKMIPVYLDAFYNGINNSEQINEISKEEWEQFFQKVSCNSSRERKKSFCRILERSRITDWSEQTLDQLIHLAMEEEEDCDTLGKTVQKPDVRTMETIVLNSVFGHAFSAIGHLLWNKEELLDDFRDTIDQAVSDSNPAVRMASFYALWPAYNIDQKWAEIRILKVYESDVRMAGQYDTKKMFFLLYRNYRERTLQVIRRCINATEKELIQVGMYTVCEFYIQYAEFEDIMEHLEDYSEEHWKAAIQMAVQYLKGETWREKGKEILLRCQRIHREVEYPISGIFQEEYIDLKRDKEFLLETMHSRMGRRTIYAFVRYLEKSTYSLKDYAEIIITLCKNMLTEELKENPKRWGIANNLSKLIIALYDQTANSSLERDRQIADKCLELWDVMFEKQIGQARVLSRELMER